ncbi:MAG: oxalurate catabolism protein HpxZ [Synechococcaceae cyanobacterium SM2_3_1]|nr:oxalurate catabolism protein HpxZ [Synechococcaceae cyanobacterium SM2_3_1]
MEEINRPEVVAELRKVYDRYEQALCSNDVVTMTELFWDSSEVVRLGIAENLYGRAEIDNFRRHRPLENLNRQILKFHLVTFGEDTGSVVVEFQRSVNGVMRQGRQSQMWRKFSQGWRVVAAHVSFLPL